jgi:hypothetical protein
MAPACEMAPGRNADSTSMTPMTSETGRPRARAATIAWAWAVASRADRPAGLSAPPGARAMAARAGGALYARADGESTSMSCRSARADGAFRMSSAPDAST